MCYKQGEKPPEEANRGGWCTSTLLGDCDRGTLPSSLFCFLSLLRMEKQGEQRALFIAQEKKGLCDPQGGPSGEAVTAEADGLG